VRALQLINTSSFIIRRFAREAPTLVSGLRLQLLCSSCWFWSVNETVPICIWPHWWVRPLSRLVNLRRRLHLFLLLFHRHPLLLRLLYPFLFFLVLLDHRPMRRAQLPTLTWYGYVTFYIDDRHAPATPTPFVHQVLGCFNVGFLQIPFPSSNLNLAPLTGSGHGPVAST
jgi:hypothetical protein